LTIAVEAKKHTIPGMIDELTQFARENKLRRAR
jgi:hypothetical protein